MAIDLAEKFLPYVDEQFSTESKKSILTNNDFSWTGASTIRAYKVSTSNMNDYDRAGTGVNWSRYGAIAGLEATTEEFTLRKDRSFTFAIDKLDTDETANQLKAASALARQVREVVVPEVDKYVYSVMCENAGHKPAPATLQHDNIYYSILSANRALDDCEVPETNRYLIVTPETYILMKTCPEIIMGTDIGNELRLKGVIGVIDGLTVIKVPAARLPEKFGFLLVHPCATVAPTKLEDYKIHKDPPGISGSLVEGRINYDAFVLDNKKNALYYQEIK